MFRDVKLTVTTDESGDGTATHPNVIGGTLYAIYYQRGTLDNSTTDVTISVTGTPEGDDKTLLTLTNVTASGWYYPRFQACDNVGSAISGEYDEVLVVGKPKVVVAQGGATTPSSSVKTGSVYLFYR